MNVRIAAKKDDVEQFSEISTSHESIEDAVNEFDSLVTKASTGCCSEIYPYGFLNQLKPMLKLSWPIIVIQITQFFFGFIASAFCGQLGTLGLDVAALSNSLINASGVSIAVGMSSACDTMFSQIYGSSNKKILGVVFQRSIIIMGLAVLPLWAFHLNVTPFLVLIGQEPEASKLAGDYLLIFMPGLLGLLLYMPLSKFLLNQNFVIAPMIIGVACNAVCVILHYVLLFVLEWGIWGSAIAQSVSYMLMSVLTLLYILVSKVYKETWSGWSSDAFQEWGTFYKLAVSGLLMVCCESWSFAAGVFLTGVIGTVELGTQSLIYQYQSIFFMFPLGLSVSTSIIVGQYLGSGHTDGAKTAARVGLTIAVFISLVFAILFGALRNYLPYAFSNDTAVVEMAASIFPIAAAYVLFDGLACVSAGVLRGCGLQHKGAYVVVTGCILVLGIGTPLMFLTSLKLHGYWMATGIVFFLETCVYQVFLLTLDWGEQVEKAHQRAKVYAEEEAHSNNTTLVDDEKQPLISDSRKSSKTSIHSRRTSRALSLSRQASQHSEILTRDLFPAPVPLMDVKPLPRTHLICRRTAVIISLLLVFVTGLLFRIFFDTSYIDDMIESGDMDVTNGLETTISTLVVNIES